MSAEELSGRESRQFRKVAMPKRPSARIQEHFAALSDPRRRKVVYPLINVVAIDGKALRRRLDAATGKSAIHRVSA